MKNLRTYEEFVNEQALFEKKELSPANIKLYNANKNSVKLLKNWSYKIKDIEAKFNDMEYWGSTSNFFEFIDGKLNTIRYMIKINDIIFNVDISLNDNKLDFDFHPPSNKMHFEIKKLNFLQYVDENEDKVLGFIDLLNFLFKNFKSEIYEMISNKLSLETLYVIKAGEIAPATGKTGHGWSIYDYPDGVLGVIKGSGMMLWQANGMKVGDKFKLLDDQTHKIVSNEVEILDLIPANYKDFVAYSRKMGREVPVAPFKKQTGRGRFTIYSIK